MRRLAVAALGFGLAACSDVPVAPNATRAPTQASFSRGGAGIPIPGQYIVRFRDDEQNVDGQASSLASTNAGQVMRVYKSAIKGMAIRIPDAAVATLRADPRVIALEQDQTVSISTTQTGATWGIDRIDQRTLPLNGTYIYNADGTGVTVYIIDTGINFTHTEYNGRAFTGIDEVTAGGTAADCNGHGSHVSGTVGGTTYGVAKKVKLVAVRVLDCSGSGTISGVVAGIDWVTAQKKATPSVPSAANMSLGGGLSTALNQAVDNSSAAGVVYAIAAGNSTADACTFSPASAPSAITVGATDINDGFAYFSNYGSCVAINAPGVDITSAWMGTTTATNTISGTSMATPHVAGAAALYLQANPTATPAQVRSALVSNGTTGVITGLPAATTNTLLYSAFISATPTPPVASFTATCSGFTCNFDASASTGATSYSWNFGDTPAGTSTLVAPSYTYKAAGTYTVTLTVTNAVGSSTTTKSVTVTTPPPVPAPVASFTVACTNLTCSFNGSASTNTTSWTWSFGDGTAAVTTTTATTTHAYTTAGTYQVTLTARNSGTATSSVTHPATPTAPPACVGGQGEC